MDEGGAFAAVLRGIVPSAVEARDRTKNFTADAVVALRMAEEGSESEKPSRWHTAPHEVQPVARAMMEPFRGQTLLLLPPQTLSRGCLVLTDLLQLVFVEEKFVRRRL